MNSWSAYHLYRPGAIPLQEKAFEYELSGSYFNTVSIFDVDGVETELGEGESFSLLQSDLVLRYGYGSKLQFSGGISFRQVQAEYFLNYEAQTATNSGVESYFISIKYAVKANSKMFYSFDLTAAQTGYSNTQYTSTSQIPDQEIALGDSGSSYSLGSHISFKRTPDHYLSAFGAFRQPANDLSAEIPYYAESAWTWRTFAFYLGLEGIYSLGTDEFSSSPSQKQPQGRAPSGLYNSINRQFMAPYGGAYLTFGSWRVGLRMSSVMAGVSTDKGTRYTISLLKASGGKSVSKKVKEKFKEYRIEATVTKTSPRGKFIQIDQGLSSDVEKGMKFDIYETDFFGGNELVATAIAFEVGLNKSILKIVKFYSSKRVQKGYTGRAQ